MTEFTEKDTLIVNEKIATDLKKSDFFYELPPELIAQTPADKRDMSRLMTVGRNSGEIGHHVFHDIADMLHEGDVLVINNSKVIPARLIGIKESTGISMELLMLRARGNDIWEVLVRPGRRAKPGTVISFGGGLLRAAVLETVEDGNRIVKLDYDRSGGENIFSVLDRIGEMPLPPYITLRASDPSRYQTVYAEKEGSAAAPTAGLHFTDELLDVIRKKGVKIAPVVLHVGLGTFRPVKEDALTDHIMHTEHIEVSKESADIINSRTGRVIAVGTTSCRVLESVADDCGHVEPVCADTGIFIYPGYRFKIVDGLITNFHLPESTLLMLVSAFSSREIMLGAYEEAIRERYRFFSFGDAMFIV